MNNGRDKLDVMQARTKSLLNQHIRRPEDNTNVTYQSLITQTRTTETSLTQAIELLEEARDLKQGIKWIRVPHKEGQIPDLIRDARNATETEAPKNSPESYAIQKLNILRAALKIAELEGMKLDGDKTKRKIGELRDNATAALEAPYPKTQQTDVKKFNTDIISFLTSIGVKEPAKKMGLIKDFMNFEDTHYNISTVSTVGGKTVVESETMLTGLTVEQKISLRDLISAKDGKSQTFEQKIITEFYPEITDGLHTIPTQLRKSLPGLKNAYLKTTYIQEGESLEAIASVHHTGAISFHGKGDKQLFTDQNARQLQSLLPAGATINQNVLNSPANPTGIDADIHRLTGEAMSQIGGYRSTTPFNFWRKFSRNDNTGHEATLSGLADLLAKNGIVKAFLPELKDSNGNTIHPKQLFPEIALYLKTGSNSDLETAKKALEKYKGYYERNGQAQEFSKVLEHAIEARRIMSNRSVIFDSNNDNLTISAHMASINHATHGKDGIISKGINSLEISEDAKMVLTNEVTRLVPYAVINCASGKDRTGLAMIMATHFAVCEKLGKNPMDPTKSADIFKQIVKSGHTQEMASMNAGSRGCHGIKKDTLGAFPAWMQEQITGLQQDTASFNKFKHNPKKVKVDDDIAKEQVKEAPKGFFGRLWDSIKSAFSRKSPEAPAPAVVPPNLVLPEDNLSYLRGNARSWVQAQKPNTFKSWVAKNPSEKLFDDLITKFKASIEAKKPDISLEADFKGLLATANKDERFTKLSEAVKNIDDHELKSKFESDLRTKKLSTSRNP